MFRSRNKEHESNKNALPCLLDTLSVFLLRTLAILVLFQWLVGSRFFSIYLSSRSTPMKQSETQAAVNSSKNSNRPEIK